MSLIKKLPDIVANKISAGEVVQRPASAVKELLENAIDAGADEITLAIKAAGKTLIQVIDNGCGLSEEDATLCFERFATSKISDVGDLENLHTLGFRGEALASIASVSQVELKTKRYDDRTGTLVKISGGRFEEVSRTETPNGTAFSIRNLFYNVPARRKFLKTNATEYKHIFETVQAQTLVYPDIKWRFYSDDEEIFSFLNNNLSERLDYFFGKDFSQNLIEFTEENDFMKLRGYLGKPAMMKRTKNQQFLFINNRVTQSKLLSSAIMTAYGELLGEREYPFFLIYMDIAPHYIDVNVHPTKMEVKFDDERNIYNMVHSVVKHRIKTLDFSPNVQVEEKPDSPRPTGESFNFPGVAKRLSYNDRDADMRSSNALFRDYKTYYKAQDERAEPGFFANPKREMDWRSSLPAHTEASLTPPKQAEPEGNPTFHDGSRQMEIFIQSRDDEPATAGQERFVWQLHNTYILTQIKSGLLIIDQHVAHERILYERAIAVMESNVPNSQQLLFPHSAKLSAWEFDVLKEIKTDLVQLGFSLRILDQRTVLVEGIPPDVMPGREERILHEMLEQYQDYQQNLKLEQRDNVAKSYACRSSIMAGQKLSRNEMTSLIDQLFATSMPYVCPHGRPIIIKLSIEELDKMFGRS
ncbi:DNA mismatch repair protein MutL [Chloroherpeton thalassium ATCC 35110]|uniref:DNA mismatch repair protein MutL n=1 Tax=Chloroherpeton thalassium (strain ATCC 35110 / GB-78) TaxID=517418 RepID=MUTL_CHLT3|nr:DNA mismatch repair endonuclease MutL [Chloroherpeton thalassium]B3QW86.1 RecName: Full=DNA mismatch repair protein MutL [Chloroherpeton thalassium ATCC 35110]ACF13199.1 DNA mismatch repair protein MutL [Chloroherpeton thalassium ATCC 35110]